MAASKLTDKQHRFAREYLIDLNGTQAAIRAGYSAKTADATASRLLRNVKISIIIQKRQQVIQQKTEITQERVLAELAKIAFAQPQDYLTVRHGQVRVHDTADISADKLAAVAGVKQGANGVEIKLHDKQKALELIGRHIGMFTDKVELSGAVATNSNKLDNLVQQLWGRGSE